MRTEGVLLQTLLIIFGYHPIPFHTQNDHGLRMRGTGPKLQLESHTKPLDLAPIHSISPPSSQSYYHEVSKLILLLYVTLASVVAHDVHGHQHQQQRGGVQGGREAHPLTKERAQNEGSMTTRN